MLPAIACSTKPVTVDDIQEEHKNNPKIIFRLDNKNTKEYKILYAFDIKTVVHIKSKIGTDKTLNFWHNKIALFFPKALGIQIHNTDDYNLTEFYNQSITYYKENQFQHAKNKIKKQLQEEKLTDFADLNKFDTKVFNEDYSSKNYDLFRKYRRILKSTAIENIDCFEHRTIISLGDGEFLIENGNVLSNGTAFQLANNLIEIKHKINITAADIAYSEKYYVSSDNIDVTFINLDNQKSFLMQGLTEKFDLVIMHRGLCTCDMDPEAQFSCAGIMIYAPSNLKKLLFNIAAIIDTSNPDSKAIMTGKNYNEKDFWEDEVQQFNIENKDNLVAEIARNKIGTFKGIIIQLAS